MRFYEVIRNKFSHLKQKNPRLISHQSLINNYKAPTNSQYCEKILFAITIGIKLIDIN